MKKCLVLLTFLLLGAAAYCGVEQADKYYQNADYARALEQYLPALQAEPNNAYLYYNIGNCYFKTGATGKAVAYYMKAFSLNPRSTPIRQNLELALTKTGQSFVPQGMPVILHKAFFLLSRAEIRGICFILGWVLCLALIIFIYRKRCGKAALAAGIMIAFFGLWYGALGFVQADVKGIIIMPDTRLKSGPGDNFDNVASLPQGYLVKTLDKSGGWVLAEASKDSNMKGWTLKENILALEDI